MTTSASMVALIVQQDRIAEFEAFDELPREIRDWMNEDDRFVGAVLAMKIFWALGGDTGATLEVLREVSLVQRDEQRYQRRAA
jgi:hypothetical protein